MSSQCFDICSAISTPKTRRFRLGKSLWFTQDYMSILQLYWPVPLVLKNVVSLLVCYLDSAGVDIVPEGLEAELLKSSEFSLNWTCPFLQVGFISSSRFFHVVVCYSPGDLRDSIELNWRFSCFTSQGRRGLPNRLQTPSSRGRLWLAHFVSGDSSLQLEEGSPPTTCFETFTGGKIVLL